MMTEFDMNPNIEIFKTSVAEATRMRRGAFLPALLILPMAAMFGFDESKSQPLHFLMIFAMASGLAAVVVSISWYGAKRRIDEFSRMTLTVGADRLTWVSSLGETAIPFAEVTSISINKVRGVVRTVTLTRRDGRESTIEGFEKMESIAGQLTQIQNAEIAVVNNWFSI